MQGSFNMNAVSIQTASKTYPVFVGSGVVKQLSSFIKSNFPSLTRLMIITDETVADLYLRDLEKALTPYKVSACIVPSGEMAKTFDVYYQCLSFALEHNLDRKSILLSFGGGAVGDLGGFVAATYMRGVPFIQVPTTILAHDSAVGGKVAINHPMGKNMIGAFYQPEAVFYDLSFLSSLPLNEKRSGFAEVIKHGLINDQDFYESLKKNIKTLELLSNENLHFFLTRGIEIKNKFVSEDEKETGIRAFLNFGHTLGHAIEAEMGYGKWTHGEAVIVGILFALEFSKKKYALNFDIKQFKNWISHLGYETKIPLHLKTENLLKRMKQDKKSIDQKVKFVLLTEIGKPILVEISDDDLFRELSQFKLQA